jgi:hypothetical protein
MASPGEEERFDQAQTLLEIDDEELDDVSGGVLAEFRGRGIQPDGGGPGAHR